MEGGRIRLTVMGLSYNQIRDGAYALMLAQVNGPYRIPVVIGVAEAQSIAVVLERVTTPRPLTHDLFTSIGHAFGIVLREVSIYNFEDGIFSATMTFENDRGETVEIDSRTSDAIAVAIRMDAPIYISREILESTGFILEKSGSGTGKATGRNADGLRVEIEWAEDGSNETDSLTPKDKTRSDISVGDLEKMMHEAVENEDYETAGKIKILIEQKKSRQP